MDFLALFVAALPAESREETGNDPKLAGALAAALKGASCDTLDLAPADFLPYLALRLPGQAPASAEVLGCNLVDLALACALARGKRPALDRFEETMVPGVRPAIARLCADSDLSEEVLQGVREKLLVGTDDRGPRIGDYAGRGELLTWLRVVAVRHTITELRKRKRLVPGDDALFEAVAPDRDPEVALLKKRAAADIKRAFEHGLGKLTVKQRNLLRQHLLDGLSIDELGAMHQVHRVTAARWLTRARGELWSHVRQQLRLELGLSPGEIESLLGDVRSSLDLSIERILS